MNLWIFGDSYSCEWNIVTGERHKEYVKDKMRADEIHYDHPIIKVILGPTFGH